MVGPRPAATAAPRFEPGPPGPGFFGGVRCSYRHASHWARPPRQADPGRGIGVRTGHLVNARLRVHWEITGFDALAPLAPETGKGGGRAAAVPRWQRPGGERTYGGAW